MPAAYPELEGEPAPYVEIPATDTGVGWSAFEPAEHEHQAEELTMIGEASSDELVLEENGAAPAAEVESAAGAEPDDAEPQPAPETPEPTPVEGKRGWFGRKGAAETPGSDAAEPSERDGPDEPVEPTEPPSHVRVLAGEDPWERGFDGDEAPAREPAAAAEPNEAPAAQGRARRR
jgi:hypothetical protein